MSILTFCWNIVVLIGLSGVENSNDYYNAFITTFSAVNYLKLYMSKLIKKNIHLLFLRGFT